MNQQTMEQISALEQQLQQSPNDVEILQQLITQYIHVQQIAKVMPLYERLSQLFPDNYAVWFNRGTFLMQTEQYQSAIKDFETGLGLAPGHPDLLNNLAICLLAIDDEQAAIQNLEQALLTSPEHVPCLYTMANHYFASAKVNDAILLYQKILQLAPGHLAALENLANAFYSSGQLDKVIALLLDNNMEHASSSKLDEFLLRALAGTNQWQRLTTVAQQKIILDEQCHIARYFLADIAMKSADYATAVSLLQEIPHSVLFASEAASLLLRCYKQQNSYEQVVTLAEACYKAHESTAANMLEAAYALRHILEYELIDKLCHRARQLLSNELINPFLLQINYRDNDLILEITKHFVHGITKNIQQISRQPNKRHNQKKRIGYISPDFNKHPVGFLVHDYLTLPSLNFDVYLYAVGLAKDESTQDFINSPHTFRDVAHLSASQIAQMIVNDQIDILIDLAGHTHGNCLTVLAHKPAAIQIQSIGYFGSMGANFIDYFITNNKVLSANNAHQFTESFAYLPEADCSVRMIENPQSSITKEQLQLTDEFVFAAFNSTYRLCQSTLLAWQKILEQCPTAVLLLYANDDHQQQFIEQRFRKYGLEPTRLRFMPNQAISESWHVLLADLVLDTLTIAGATATLFNCWAGVPTLTCAQADVLQSMSSAVPLSAVNADHWITSSIDEYIHMAIKLYREPDALAEFRACLMRARSQTSMFNPEKFTVQLENLYQELLTKDG